MPLFYFTVSGSLGCAWTRQAMLQLQRANTVCGLIILCS